MRLFENTQQNDHSNNHPHDRIDNRRIPRLVGLELLITRGEVGNHYDF
jgi:hypothetical protein